MKKVLPIELRVWFDESGLIKEKVYLKLSQTLGESPSYFRRIFGGQLTTVEMVNMIDKTLYQLCQDLKEGYPEIHDQKE